MTDTLQSQFASHFGGEGILYAAPGRINLIGEHTDYNGGFVLPAAIDKRIYAIVRPNHTLRVNLLAADLQKQCSFNIDDPNGPTETDFRYVFGTVRELIAAGVPVEGFDAAYCGDIPLGAGLSSSAALECCFANALNDMFGNAALDRMALARVGQAAEHHYVGVKCGIMDQFASMFGKANMFMRLDCRSGEYSYHPWHTDDYRLVLINSCVKHELVGSPYNDRRASCERVAALAGIESLRDCTWDMLHSLKDRISPEDFRRARYVIGEADRVMTVCQALEHNNFATIGKQMYLTHDGLRDDYEVSCPEIDFLVDEARTSGVTGSRIMGGGFGGCTINLVHKDILERFVACVQESYLKRFGVACQPINVAIGDGARKL